MSETSNAASFRWDDMRCAASHALRSCLRSILPHKQWEVSTSAQVCREWLQLPREIVTAHGAALGPRGAGLIRMHGIARLEVARSAHPDGLLIAQKGPCRSAVSVSERA